MISAYRAGIESVILLIRIIFHLLHGDKGTKPSRWVMDSDHSFSYNQHNWPGTRFQ